MKRSVRLMTIVWVYSLLARVILSVLLPIKLLSIGFFIDAFFLIGILMIATALLKKAWMQKVFYSVFVFIVTLVAIADVMFYHYFNRLTTRANAQGLTFMSADLTVEYDLSILPAIGILLLFVGMLVFVLVKQPRRDYLRHKDYLFLVVLVVVYGAVVMNLHRHDNEPTLAYFESDTYAYYTNYDALEFSRNYGYYFYHALDLFRFKEVQTIQVSYEDIATYIDTFEAPTSTDHSGLFAGSNVIQITVESLDTRFIDETISPTLYHLMHNGYRFDSFYVPVVNQGATCNSEFMAMTGLYAYPSHAFSNNACYTYKDIEYPYSIPNQLKAEGYETYYFHSGHQWFYQRETLMPNIGFDTVKFLEDVEALDETDFDPLYDPDLMVFMDNFVIYEQPFYIHFLTYGLHGAYQPSIYEAYDAIIDEVYSEPLDIEIRVYLQKLAAFDAFLTQLIATLDEHGLYDDTLLVINADHYPFMIETNTYETFLGIDTETTELYRQSLIMYHPDMTPQSFDKVGSTIDLAPTVLNLVHRNPNVDYFFGEDLLYDGAGYVLFPDMSIYDGVDRYYLNKPFEGDIVKAQTLRDELIESLTEYEVARQVLNQDFFRWLKEEKDMP